MSQCLVHTCNNNRRNNKNISFHKLPQDPELKKLWLIAVNRDFQEQYSHYNVVCSDHFKKEDFIINKKVKRIRKTAIPSEKLPSLFQVKRKHHYEEICVDNKSLKMDSDYQLNHHQPNCSGEMSLSQNVKDRSSFQQPIEKTSDINISSTSSCSEERGGPKVEDINEVLSNCGSLRSHRESPMYFNEKELLGELPFPCFEVTIPYMPEAELSDVSIPSRKCKEESDERSSSGSSIKRRRRFLKMFHNYCASPSSLQKRNDTLVAKHRRVLMDNKNKSKQVRRLKKKIYHLKDIVSDLRKKNILSTNALSDLEKTIPDIPLAMMKRLIVNTSRKKPTREQYPEELRAFALTLNFYSCKAYEYVRKTFCYCLPHQSVIRSWYSKIDCSPGYTSQSFELLKEKNTEYENEQKALLCSLMLDEMSIKKKVEMVGNKVYGYVDLGTGLDDDEEAQEALVLMVVAVNGNWKIPIAYFLIKSLTGTEKASIITESLTRLHNNKIRIISLTCDGPSSHFSMLKELGCKFNFTNSIHDIQFWFLHPCNEEIKIYAILDPSHMLKLIRNMLCKYAIIKNPDGEDICWAYIKKLFDIQSEQQLNLGNKIKRSHIYWQKQKMKVSLAAQTLSNSVAEALEYLREDEKMEQFKNSKATIEFIRVINGVFDYLNSRNPFAKGTKSALRKSGESVFKPFLENAIDFLGKCTDIQGNLLLNTPRKTGILGFIISIKSILSLYDEYVKPETAPLKYLLTYKLSQDHLELYFCWIRSRNGWCNNPSAHQMTQTYKRLLLHHEIKKNTGSCIQIDDSNILAVSSRSKPHVTQTIDISDVNVLRKYGLDMESPLSYSSVPQIPHVPGLSTFIENVVAYMAGYVIRMVKSRIKCLECIEALEEGGGDSIDDNCMKFLRRKNKGGLLKPSTSVFEICRVYEVEIRRMLHITNNKLPPENSYQKLLIHFNTQKLLQNGRIFENLEHHIFDTSIGEELHKKKLIEQVGFCFLKIRMHYIGKLHTERISGDLIRKQFSKLILFHHQ